MFFIPWNEIRLSQGREHLVDFARSAEIYLDKIIWEIFLS